MPAMKGEALLTVCSLRRRVEELEQMLAQYYRAVHSVPATEQVLLSELLKELEASLDPGFQVLNWNSLGISDFVAQCRKAITDFNTKVSQVLKNKKDLEALVAAMRTASLLPQVDGTEVPTLQARTLPG
jgi:dynein heavy chain, axonemal